MSDSVGKISLDLEVTSDLVKQISAVSNAMGKKLKDTMDSATKSMFDGMNGNMNKSVQSMSNTLKSGLNKMKQNIRSTFSSGLDVLKNIKMPAVSFPKMDVLKPKTSNVTQEKTTRGPPTFNAEGSKVQIDNIAQKLDIINIKIGQQQARLAELKESYANTFNEVARSNIQEKMSNIELVINRLIVQSNRLGSTLAELDVKYNTLASTIKNANAKTTQAMESNVRAVNEIGNALDKVSSKINSFNKEKNIMEEGAKATTKNTNAVNAKGNALNNASSKVGAFTSKVNGTLNVLKNLSNPFKNLTSIAKLAGNSFNVMHNGIMKVGGQLTSFILKLPMITQGLQEMGDELLNSLNSNAEFANSLSQIKTNLSVTFTPIFYAILPAINALMSALATATTYIASFISSIFGKTYQQSFQAAQGLTSAKEAMGAYGDSAKKAAKDAGGLAGFDEINKLGSSNASDDAGGDSGGSNSKEPTLVQPNINTSVVDGEMKTLADKIRTIMSQVFKPFQQAWAAEGLNTVNSIKYAFSQIGTLISDIGKSFLSVWTNGTGKITCTLILQILQNVFKIIGDIASSFSRAWNSGNVGTQIIQNIFNSLNNVLGLIKDIGDNWIKAWNDNGAGDRLASSRLIALRNITGVLSDITAGVKESFGKATESLFPTFINFCTNIDKSLSDLATGFKIVWDNGGKVLFDGIVQLVTQVADLIMNMSSTAFADFATLFKNTLAPAIGDVFDVVGNVLGKLSEFIGWINTNKPIIDGLTTTVEAFMAAWAIGKVVEFINTSGGIIGAITNIGTALAGTTIAQGAYNVVSGIGTALTTAWSGICAIASIATTALGVAFNILCSPITLVILAVAAVIAIVVLLITHWDTVKKVASNVWNKIVEIWSTVAAWFNQNVIQPLANFFAGLWNSIVNIFNGVRDWFSSKFSGAWEGIKGVFRGVGSFFGGIWDTIKQQFTSIGSVIGNAIGGAFKYVVNSIINFAENTINGFIWAINRAIDLINYIPGVNISPLDPLSIPRLAKGGILDSPTLAMVGEAGKEAVMPLENNTGWIDSLASKLMDRMPQQSGGDASNGSDRPIELVLQIDNTKFGKAIVDSYNKLAKQEGRILLNL